MPDGMPYQSASVARTSAEDTGRPRSPMTRASLPLNERGAVSMCVALARSAATVQFSRPKMAMGSKLKNFIAFRWVSLSIT